MKLIFILVIVGSAYWAGFVQPRATVDGKIPGLCAAIRTDQHHAIRDGWIEYGVSSEYDTLLRDAGCK